MRVKMWTFRRSCPVTLDVIPGAGIGDGTGRSETRLPLLPFSAGPFLPFAQMTSLGMFVATSEFHRL